MRKEREGREGGRESNACERYVISSYVLGHDAMRKMVVSNVLIVGMKGLGIEIGWYPRQLFHGVILHLLCS